MKASSNESQCNTVIFSVTFTPPAIHLYPMETSHVTPFSSSIMGWSRLVRSVPTLFIKMSRHGGTYIFTTKANKRDKIYRNTFRDNIARNKHFLAPEWGSSHEAANNTAIDIYAFGVCALETAALELVPGSVHPPSSSVGSNGAKEGTGDKPSNSMQQGGANGTNGNHSAADSEGGVVFVTEESIQKTIDCLEDEMQKDFIRKCLRKTPEDRPTARELLFHPVLFEVHSLKLLAAHILVNTPGNLFLLLLLDFKRNLYRESVVFELSSLYTLFTFILAQTEVDTSKPYRFPCLVHNCHS